VPPLTRPNPVSLELAAVPNVPGGRPVLVADLVQFSLPALVLGGAWLREGSVRARPVCRQQLVVMAVARGPHQRHGRYLTQPPRRRRRQRVTNVPRCRDGSV